MKKGTGTRTDQETEKEQGKMKGLAVKKKLKKSIQEGQTNKKRSAVV